MGSLSEATSLKKTDSLFPQNYQLPIAPVQV